MAKHSLKITFFLLGLFIITQLIGLGVSYLYSSNAGGSLPSWIEPPSTESPQVTLASILIAVVLGAVLMLILMNIKAARFLRIWFFLVVAIAISITLNAFVHFISYSFLLSFLVALPMAYGKVFVRDIRVHNFTELLIYPGIAALFIPLLNIWTACILLIFISLYDMYAVWHAGFMQKMAKYQIQKLKFFAGFFVPYQLPKAKLSGKSKKKVKMNVAILGGGDVVFPIIVSGVVLSAFGLFSALLITLGASASLLLLFFLSQKGKFYPAMPFISIGCFAALAVIYLLQML